MSFSFLRLNGILLIALLMFISSCKRELSELPKTDCKNFPCTWTEPTPLGFLASSSFLKVVIDKNNAIFALWPKHDAESINIYANHYGQQAGWQVAQNLDIEASIGSSDDVEIVTDAKGNAFAAWYRFDQSVKNIWFSQYIKNQGWQNPVLLQSDCDCAHPQIATVKGGGVIVAWSQLEEDGTFGIYIRQLSKEGAWGTRVKIAEVENVINLDVKIISNSDASRLAVWWWVDDGSNKSIHLKRYSVDSAWADVELISLPNVVNLLALNLGISSTGKISLIQLWQEVNQSSNEVYAAHYHDEWGWGDGEIIASNVSSSLYITGIYFDDAGSAFVVRTAEQYFFNDIYVSRYQAGSGWQSEVLIKQNAGDIPYPRFAVDKKSGNAMIAWNQLSETNREIFVSRFYPNTGWRSVEKIAAVADTGDVFEIAINEKGQAVMVSLNAQDWSLWARHYY